MKLIRSLMGRRQFLMATGAASACALTCRKLAGFLEKGGKTATAMAADKAIGAGIDPASNHCPYLLSPLKIRNVVLKNRIMHTQSPPHAMQGPENYPTDAYRNHYSNMAKNAAIVTVETHFGTYPKTYSDPPRGADYFTDHNWQDIPPVYNYVQRLIEDIHCEGALAHYSGNLGGMPSGGSGGGGGEAPGRSGGEGPPSGNTGGGAPAGAGGQARTVNIEELVTEAKRIEDMGYDVMSTNVSSPEQLEAIRNATNLIIISKLRTGSGSSIRGMDPTTLRWNYPGVEYDWQFAERTPGITNEHRPTDEEIEQAVEAAKEADGLADIFWLRDGRVEHPNGWIQDKAKPFSLYYAEAIKAAGVKTIICPSAGFHLAEQNDQFIANGQMDMVGMTTPFFADAQYIKKAYEGRFEDIVPCLMCHECHGLGRGGIGPYYDRCNVNPEWATPMYKLKNIPAATARKKVAVIGGGPGGMKAALTAAERGHQVTLYEKGSALGGLLKFTDYTQWRWTYKDFKDYLIRQVEKAGIAVKLNTAATPEMIQKAGYDTVLVATGAEPVATRMPGADGDNVFDILTVYTNKKALGKNVVMIGSGRIGTECAIGIAKDGHKITQLATSNLLIELELIGPHNMMNQVSILQNHPNYDCILEVTPQRISGGKVYYTDKDGKEKSIKADSVVIYSGLRPKTEEAMEFSGTARQVLLLGDCTGKNGSIQKTMRSAYFMASQV